MGVVDLGEDDFGVVDLGGVFGVGDPLLEVGGLMTFIRLDCWVTLVSILGWVMEAKVVE